MKILLIIGICVLYTIIAFIIDTVWHKIFIKNNKDKYYTLNYTFADVGITVLSLLWPLLPFMLILTSIFYGIDYLINKLWN